jgi:hypothetical protein
MNTYEIEYELPSGQRCITRKDAYDEQHARLLFRLDYPQAEVLSVSTTYGPDFDNPRFVHNPE